MFTSWLATYINFAMPVYVAIYIIHLISLHTARLMILTYVAPELS